MRPVLLAALLIATSIATAGTRETPAARAEIERFAGPYPSAQFGTLKRIYATHINDAGFPKGEVTAGLKYGPNERHRLDVIAPTVASEGPAPVLVFVHGGAFVRGERSDGHIYDNVLHYFARHGFVGINATYRLAPQHQWPAAAEDLANVVAWVRENAARYGGDPGRIFLMGHSAGAVHVASYAFMESLQPSGGSDGVLGAVLLSGVYGDAADRIGDHVYFGASPKQRVPLHFVDGRAIPLFVIDSEYDPVGMQRSALELVDAVCRRDGRCPRHLQVAGHNHFSMVFHINTLDDSLSPHILDFLRSHADD